MKSLKPRTLILVFVLVMAAGSLINGLSVGAGGPVVQLPLVVVVTALLIASVTLVFGLEVKKYSDPQRRAQAKNMSHLLAARVAVLAQSSAYTGVVLAGWQSALLVFQLSLFSARQMWAPLLEAGAGILGGAVMVAVGLLVEGWCKIPPRDGDDTGPQPRLSERQSRGYARGDQR